MDSEDQVPPEEWAAPTTPPAPLPPAGLPVLGWLWQGLRLSVLQKPHFSGAPNPLQLLLLFALQATLLLALARLEVSGPAEFSVFGWLYPWCTFGFLIFAVWAVLRRPASQSAHAEPVAAWMGLSVGALLPLALLGQALWIAAAHEMLPAWWFGKVWPAWVAYGLMSLWPLAIVLRLTAQFTPSHARRAALVGVMALLQAFAAWQLGDYRPWYAMSEEASGEKPVRLELSQALFEEQQVLLASALSGLQAAPGEGVHLYGLVYAPWSQDVFQREAGMVASVLQQQFDAKGRVLQFVNHPNTAHTIPWATAQNLQKAIQAVASVMDRERDVLVVYMTSHGGSNFELASQHPPLSVEALTPQMLRQMLDDAGIRHRVLAISACYSGGWVEPLESDTTLVMTAADATHTSYGCGSKSELTFFGRAVFAEQLGSNTHSFETAFQNAVPVIRQREIEGKKSDGFSNPQISVGAGIRPVLAQLEARLQAPSSKP